MKKFISLAFIFLLTNLIILQAQVTIGRNGDPAEGALLELRDKAVIGADNTNSIKG